MEGSVMQNNSNNNNNNNNNNNQKQEMSKNKQAMCIKLGSELESRKVNNQSKILSVNFLN